jgi:hypothetical protein
MLAIALRQQSGILKRFAVSVATVAVLLFLGYVALLLVNLDDILRAYPSPEQNDHVRELPLSDAQVTSESATDSATGDFDGDGTPDELTVEYFHIEPLFSRATSGMLHVVSGRTRELLLARVIDTPFSEAKWCGDLDGNGTDDLRIHDEGRWRALGYQRER